CPETIVPPLTVQAYVAPTCIGTDATTISPGNAVAWTWKFASGSAWTAIARSPRAEAPAGLVTTTSISIVPGAPAVTITSCVPCPASIVPLVTTQSKVHPGCSGTLARSPATPVATGPDVVAMVAMGAGDTGTRTWSSSAVPAGDSTRTARTSSSTSPGTKTTRSSAAVSMVPPDTFQVTAMPGWNGTVASARSPRVKAAGAAIV